MRAFLAELHRRDPLLSRTAWAHVGVALVFAAALPFDERTVLGANPWIKPLKFAVSIALYLFTVAWLLHYVRPGARRAASWISKGVSLAMVVEIACISVQSLRGVPSHFNEATAFDGAVFGAMGMMIAVNTILMVVLLVLFLVCETHLPRPQVWGIRFGIALLLLASGVGGRMVGGDAHSVGGPDGGRGLPFVGWSTEHGDLRPAHALGLHALQVLPLFGWWAVRLRAPITERKRTALVAAFATAYLAAFGALLLQALAGRPLFS